MAKYSITSNVDQTWDDAHVYSYRHWSADGLPLAQDEVARRVAGGPPAYVWKWENNQPVLMGRFDATAPADG